MPGRLAIFDDTPFKNEARKIFPNVKNKIKVFTANYNTAPTHLVPVLLDTKVYTYAHFGLIPSWAKDKKSININARSETLFEKKSFRDSFKNKRCLIPVNGFYEWEKRDNEKIPYFVHSFDENCFALAGLWDEWYDASIEKYILTVSLITTQPNETIQKIHDRMPIVLDKKDWGKWLNKESSLEELNKLFVPCSNDIMQMHEVSSLINAVSNNNKECIVKKAVGAVYSKSLF